MTDGGVAYLASVIASEAKQSMSPRNEKVNCFVAFAPRNDVVRIFKTRLRDLAARGARGLASIVRASDIRGRRECRARDAPAASRAMKKAHERSHHGHTGTTRHSPRNGFTAYFVLSPVTTLV
jgi:hypothetical protein